MITPRKTSYLSQSNSVCNVYCLWCVKYVYIKDSFEPYILGLLLIDQEDSLVISEIIESDI